MDRHRQKDWWTVQNTPLQPCSWRYVTEQSYVNTSSFFNQYPKHHTILPELHMLWNEIKCWVSGLFCIKWHSTRLADSTAVYTRSLPGWSWAWFHDLAVKSITAGWARHTQRQWNVVQNILLPWTGVQLNSHHLADGSPQGCLDSFPKKMHHNTV